MKKLVVALTCFLFSFLLVGCWGTSEEAYLASIEHQSDRLETMGENLNTFGDQMFDGDYDAAFVSLWIVQDDVDALFIKPYVWTDTKVETISQERTSMLEKTNEMLALLRPILEKLKANPEYTGTDQEIVSLERAEALTLEIDEHLNTIASLVEENESDE